MKSFLLSASHALALVLIVSACSKTTLPSSGGGGGSGPVGTVDNAAGFYVHTIDPSNITYDIHKSTDSNGQHNDCVAVEGESITCYVEAEELDLQHKGVSLQINVPSDMCSWLSESPYYYYSYETGTGHTSVRVNTDAALNVGIDCNDDGSVTGAGDSLPERIGGSLTGSGFVFCDTDADTNWDPNEPTTRNRCIYDYSNNEGPNCCAGNYSSVTAVWDSTILPAGDYVSVTNNNISWGGDASSCIAGPAVKSQPKNKAGFPMRTIYQVDGVGINKQYDIDAPSSQEQPQIYAANFFLTAENGGTVPAPMQGLEPYYRYQCLDHAKELKAQIMVLVREWNTETEFKARRTDWSASNITGAEPGNFSSFQLNDEADWKDWYDSGAIYPNPASGNYTRRTGPTLFPQLMLPRLFSGRSGLRPTRARG